MFFLDARCYWFLILVTHSFVENTYLSGEMKLVFCLLSFFPLSLIFMIFMSSFYG